MYFKIKNTVLFRRYEEFGYITDNSLFGYRPLNDTTLLPGEEYVSESGAVMLDVLNKTPQHIDNLIQVLLKIFEGVEYEELKQDTLEFYMMFVDAGFLDYGKTVDECIQFGFQSQKNNEITMLSESPVAIENCDRINFHQSDFLRSLHIEIASECNERCVHCYIPHEYKTTMIDSDLCFRILEEGRALNILNATLSGGEPLLHRDIIGILSKCRELDLSVNLLSNLTLLTEDIVLEMEKNPLLCVQTSLYSMNPEVHDSITKVKGSFEKTMKGIVRMQAAGIPLQISCPIMQQNKDSFIEVVHWCQSQNIAIAIDYSIFASYDHSNCNLVHRLNIEDVCDAFDKMATKEYIQALLDAAAEKERATATEPICSICRYYLCITAEGEVFPCVGWQSKKLGNLFQQSLSEIWKSSPEIHALRSVKRDQFPACIECEDRGYCTVCMMSNSNENSNGDAFSVNPFHCEVAATIHDKVISYSSILNDSEE